MKFYKIIWVFPLAFLLFIEANFANPSSSLSFIILNPGGPGDNQQAQSAMAEFGKVLGKLSGHKVEAAYFSDEKKGVHYLKTKKSSLGILSPFCYLNYREKWNLNLQLQIKKSNSLTNRYYLLSLKKNPFKTFADLKGKSLFSHHFHNSKWLSLLFFKNKNTLVANYQLIVYNKYLRAVRKMVQGKTLRGKSVDGMILDHFEWEALQKQPQLKVKYGNHLKVVAISEDFPTMVVVSIGKVSPEIQKVLKALQKFPQDKAGKKILELFTMDKFVPIKKELFEKVEKINFDRNF